MNRINRVVLLSIFLAACASVNDPEDMNAHKCEFFEGYADDVDDALGADAVTCRHHDGCSGRPAGSSGQL